MDASVMTVSMAGAEEKQNQAQQKPVFHDFLGICSGHRGRKRKDSIGGTARDSAQKQIERDCLQKQVEREYLQKQSEREYVQMENGRIYAQKQSEREYAQRPSERDYVQNQNEKNYVQNLPKLVMKHEESMRSGTLASGMRPPSQASDGQNPQVFHNSKHSSGKRPSMAMVHEPGFTVQIGNERMGRQGNSCSTIATSREDLTMMQGACNGNGSGREAVVALPSPSLPLPPHPPPSSLCIPSDEGSRTGTMALPSHLNVSNAYTPPPAPAPAPAPAPPPPPPPLQITPHLARSKSMSQAPLSSSPYDSSQLIAPRTPTSKQLTIFYGGQAHVFEDVPLKKLEAIIDLAGSSGRSWSTTYSHPSKSSRDGSPSFVQDRDGEKSMNRASTSDAIDTPSMDISVYRQESAVEPLSKQQEKRGGFEVNQVG